MKWLLTLLFVPVCCMALAGGVAALSFNIVYASEDIPPVLHAALCNENEGSKSTTECLGEVANDSIAFSRADIKRAMSGRKGPTRLNLLDATYNLTGHMELNDKLDDKGQNPSIGGFLIVGEQHIPGEEGWDYYTEGEHMVSMLVKPAQVNPSRKPLLLVHGIGGTYPYFGTSFITKLNAAPQYKGMFDIWQFYYPNNQQIERNAPMLGKALELIQVCGYAQNDGRVNVLAHSMGGLVTRALVQNINPEFKYRHNLGKLCLLGTPNHGSHSAFRISHPQEYPVSWALNELFTLQDERSPAIRQMYPGSSFLSELNSRPPDPLYPGSEPGDSYLVVAGIHSPYYPWEAESCLESNDDSLVALASASLLDSGIPLVTVPHRHSELAGRGKNHGANLDPFLIAEFFSDSYSQEQPEFISNVAGFWTSPPDSSSATLGSVICIRMVGKEINTPLQARIDPNTMTIQLIPATPGKTDTVLPGKPDYHAMIVCETSGEYSATYTFMENETSSQPGARKLIKMKSLACPIKPGPYRVELYRPDRQLLWARDGCLTVHNGCTSYLDINLTRNTNE
jgi:pimeloyl-ACP methyl ester carboxylesterase